MRLAIRHILAQAYRVVRLLVPLNPRQLLFHSYPDADDNALVLYERALESPDLSDCNFVWLADDPEEAKARVERMLATRAERTSFVRKNSLAGLRAFARSAVVFTTHGTLGFARSAGRQKIVNLWHGMPLKRCGLTDGKSRSEVQFCTHAIATSGFFAEAMAQAFGVPLERVRVTGLPRNDWLRRPQDWRSALQVENGHSLCVWMPTFRNSVVGEVRTDGGETLTPELLAEIDRQIDGSGVFLLIKLHPMDALNSRAWPNYRNVKVLSHPAWTALGLNVYRVLADADRLVTDFSSVAVDYAILRRPIGLYVPDIELYTRGFTPGALDRFTAVMQTIKDTQSLVDFILGGSIPERDESAWAELNARGTENASLNVLRSFNLIER